MKIPETLKVGGHTFKIIFDANLIQDRNRYAEVNYRTNEITVDPTSCEEQQIESLLHEIIEVIDGHCELGLAHQVIKTLSFNLYQALKDNEMLR